MIAIPHRHRSVGLLSIEHSCVEVDRPFARAQHQLRSHLCADPARKIRAGRIVDRNSDHPAKRASEKRRHPFRTVRPPQQHGVALYNVARFQLAGKLISNSCDPRIAPALAPVSSRKHVGTAVAPALEIVQRIQYTCPHTLFSSTIPTTLQARTVTEQKLYGINRQNVNGDGEMDSRILTLRGWPAPCGFIARGGCRMLLARLALAVAMSCLVACQPPASTGADRRQLAFGKARRSKAAPPAAPCAISARTKPPADTFCASMSGRLTINCASAWSGNAA
jgi:hypothetical protein